MMFASRSNLVSRTAGLMASTLLVVSLTACGGDDDPPVDRIELAWSSQLLTSVGDTAQLRATAFDESGAALAGARLTWRSADPDVVAVDADGVIEARVAAGSTQVWAEVDGVESPRAWAWVAVLPAGATTFTDDQVVSGPSLLDPATPVDLGSQLTVVVSGIAAPAPGTIVIAEQDTPVSGKVVSTAAGAGGVTLTLEVVDLAELFVDLELEMHDSVAVVQRSGEHRFTLGGFECETNVSGPQWPTPALDGIVSDGLSVDRDLVLSISDGTPQHVLLRVRGTLRVDVGGTLTFPVALTGKLTCEREGGTLTFPFQPPPLAVVLALKVPLGFGFEAEGSFSATGVVYHAAGFARANLDFGFEYTPETGLQKYTDFTKDHDLRVSWDTPALTQGGTVKASLFAYVFGTMKLGSPLTDLVDVDIATLKAGVKGDYELAVPIVQVDDPTQASQYQVCLHGELSPGEGYQKFLKRFGIDLETVQLDPPEDDCLARSPTSTTSTSTTAVVAGQPVTVTTALDASTVDYIDHYNVESVRVWRNDPTDGWIEVAEIMASDDQTVFDYQWTPTPADEAAGEIQFSAYVETTETLDVLLEVEPDWRQNLGEGDRLLYSAESVSTGFGNVLTRFTVWRVTASGTTTVFDGTYPSSGVVILVAMGGAAYLRGPGRWIVPLMDTALGGLPYGTGWGYANNGGGLTPVAPVTMDSYVLPRVADHAGAYYTINGYANPLAATYTLEVRRTSDDGVASSYTIPNEFYRPLSVGPAGEIVVRDGTSGIPGPLYLGVDGVLTPLGAMVYDARFALDGTKIYYRTSVASTTIIERDVASGVETPLALTVPGSGWAPEDGGILFLDNGMLRRFDLATETITDVGATPVGSIVP